MGSKNHMKYPRRQAARAVLRAATGRLIRLFGDLEVVGTEHVPVSGPVILAANHFKFVDPPLVLFASPRMVEFIGGANRPNSPLWARMIPQLWGFIRAYRGGFSRSTFKQSLSVLSQDGVLGIFPEGGSWASLLRPARPGLAYIALQSQACVVPISITGAEDLLSGPRREVKIQFHPAMAPPRASVGGKARRAELDAYADQIMAQIAMGLPDGQRGKFSTNSVARDAALAVSDFPFHAEELRGG